MNRNVSWKAVAVLGAMLITAAGAWAQSHASYDKANEVTIKGTVVSLSQVAGGWFAGTHLNVKQADGNIIDIHVGPRSFYEGQHFTFANGDQVEAIGSKAQFLGSDALLARQIKKGNLVLPLRDEHAVPLWMPGAHH
jgi:hypothetical protein